MEHSRNAPKTGGGIRADLARAGLLPEGDHTVIGPGGGQLPATTSLSHQRRLSRLDAVSRDALFSDGWAVVSIKGGDEEGGVTSHRGVLHPDEYVDHDVLRRLVEEELGFTCEQVHSVFRQGPLSDDQRRLRGAIDARLLALSRSGGSMVELGRALGFPVKENGNCRALENALARARKEQA